MQWHCRPRFVLWTKQGRRVIASDLGELLDGWTPEVLKEEAIRKLDHILFEIAWWMAVYGRSSDWLGQLWRDKDKKAWSLTSKVTRSVAEEAFKKQYPLDTASMRALIDEVLARLQKLAKKKRRKKDGTR